RARGNTALAHLSAPHRPQYLSLVRGQGSLDRRPQGIERLRSLELLVGGAAALSEPLPTLGVEHDLPPLPSAPPKLHSGLKQGELVGPGSEAARAAKVIELRQDRHQGVVRRLHGDVIEL